jgi:hypothetical protein
VPSGGARHSFGTYLFANRNVDQPEGLYRFISSENKRYLERAFREGMAEVLDAALDGQF